MRHDTAAPDHTYGIKRRVCLHPVNEETGAVLDGLRMDFLVLMTKMQQILPDSREASSAIHHLDDALSDAVKALVRYQDDLDVVASYDALLKKFESNSIKADGQACGGRSDSDTA